MKIIEDAMRKLEKRHDEHIKVYGAHNEERLTGQHETAPMHQFRYGVSDRGASVRIPMATANLGYGLFRGSPSRGEHGPVPGLRDPHRDGLRRLLS